MTTAAPQVRKLNIPNRGAKIGEAMPIAFDQICFATALKLSGAVWSRFVCMLINLVFIDDASFCRTADTH